MQVREGHTGRGDLSPVRATTQTKPKPPPPLRLPQASADVVVCVCRTAKRKSLCSTRRCRRAGRSRTCLSATAMRRQVGNGSPARPARHHRVPVLRPSGVLCCTAKVRCGFWAQAKVVQPLQDPANAPAKPVCCASPHGPLVLTARRCRSDSGASSTRAEDGPVGCVWAFRVIGCAGLSRTKSMRSIAPVKCVNSCGRSSAVAVPMSVPTFLFLCPCTDCAFAFACLRGSFGN